MREPVTVVSIGEVTWHMRDLCTRAGLTCPRYITLSDYKTVPGSVVLATGEKVLNSLCGLESIEHWRGSVVKGRNGEVIIPTYDPAELGRVGTPLIVRDPAVEHIIVRDTKRAVAAAEGKGLEEPEYRFTVNPTINDVRRIFIGMLYHLEYRDGLVVSLDVETKESFILTIALAWTKLDSLCIPFVKVSDGYTSYWKEEEELEVVEGLRFVLMHPNCWVIWQNGLFDAQHMLKNWLFSPKNGGDTMLRQHVCFPGMKKRLDFIASFQCDYYKQWKGIARDL